jgi:hypothetical protein
LEFTKDPSNETCTDGKFVIRNDKDLAEDEKAGGNIILALIEA